MFVGRSDELESIRRHISAKPDEPGTASIISLYGLFGAGKSTLLRQVRSLVEAERSVEAMFVTNEDISSTTLPEFVYQLATGFHSLVPEIPRFSLEETDSRRRRYLQIVGRLGADAMPLLQQLRSEQLQAAGSSEYGDKQLDADMFAFEVAVKNQFNNPDDQRLTLDTGNVMAEALLVDMMTTFYPLTPERPSLASYLEHGEAPRKVLFVIDTFEKITPLVNPWLLESLLPFIYLRRFGDFQSYRTPYIPDSIYVRDFFDARFLIAGRERVSLTDGERRWDRYRERLTEMRVGPFSREELSEFLRLSGFTDKGIVDHVMELTQGLPYLVSLWVDASKADTAGAESAFVSSLAEQRIFWYKTPEQREWIRAAAFLDWFDADALRCFAPVGDQAMRAFEYLRSTSEVARPSSAQLGKFELHAIIRQALREATFQESSDRALDFQESAAAFYEAFELLSRFESRDRDLLRRLAYFARFDDEAISGYFGGEAHLVRALIASAPDLFEKQTHTTSLTRPAAAKLERYNRCADRAIYNATLDSVRRLWEERRARLEGEIDELNREINEAEERIRELGVESHRRRELRDKLGQGVTTLESEMRLARTRWQRRLTPREVMVARASFFFLALSVLMIFAADAIPVEADGQQTIRTASLAMSLLFLVIFSIALGRILYMRSRRQEHQLAREDVHSVEKRLLDRQYEYHDVAAQTESAIAEIGALKDRIDQLGREIARRRELLTEPYV